MQPRRNLTLALLLTLTAVVACDDDSPAAPAPRVLTTVNVSIATPTLEVGQMTTATASALDQDGAPIATGAVSWSSETPTVAGVNQTTGFLFAVAPGTTRITATVDGKVGERPVTVAQAPPIRISEIQPRADQPTGWIEFFNPTAAAVDLAEWSLIDANFFGPTFRFPAGSVIPAGGFLVIEEAVLPFGLDANDSAHLFSRFGVNVDGTFWDRQPATTLGRCSDTPGVLVVTTAPTKGTANACPEAGQALGARQGTSAFQAAS